MKKEDFSAFITFLVTVVIGALVALAASQGGISIGNLPVFAIGVALAYLIQWIVFIPSYINRTEKFFDLTGGITYSTVTILSMLLSGKTDLRSLVLSALVLVWAIRLASFLFMRVRKAGEDRRFREIKQSFWRFLQTWTLQGLWVTFTLAAALAVITSRRVVGFDLFLVIGVLVWAIGFAVEVAADTQKSRFKADPANDGKFIHSGIWAWSRHPNYFGEIVLWIGVAIIALPVLQGWQWVTLISPLFVTLLLTKVSGIPMLEERADKKWGGQPDYEDYKANTPVLIPAKPKEA
jgi:steroid 5-alpha reductase family enzyme